MTTNTYKQYIPDLQLSIERSTGVVPNDGRFHVLHAGKVLGSFSSLKKAQELYKGVITESNYKPLQVKAVSQGEIDRYLDKKSLYWAERGALDYHRRGVTKHGGY